MRERGRAPRFFFSSYEAERASASINPPTFPPLRSKLRRVHGQPGRRRRWQMQALPAVCQPVLPEAVDPSPAASPAAPASSKKHERELAEVLCAFCHEGEDSDDPDEDPIIPIETGRAKQHYAHENCIWWCPDVWQDKDLKWQNVGKALSRCHRLKVVRVRVSSPPPPPHPCPCPYL